MKKTNFLLSSFKKALDKPKTTLFKDFILCYRNSHSGFILADKSECAFAPYFIKTPELDKLYFDMQHDIKRNRNLKEETEIFNHYFCENIIIEDDGRKISALRAKFDLHTLSRQSAQIKCLKSSLFPAEYFAKIPEINREFAEIEKQIIDCFKKNENCVKTVMIEDFSAAYDKIMHRFCLWDLCCPQNKKILRKSLEKVVDCVVDGKPLPADFADEKVFKMPFSVFKSAKNYRTRYVNELLLLSDKIMLMREHKDLPELVREKLQNRAEFEKQLQYFRNAHYSPNFDDVADIRNLAQNLYENFALICYFNALAKSFEIFYETDNPLPQNSALPSVAPTKEIEKIEKIIQKAQTITANGRLAKKYREASANFALTAEKLKTALNRFNGSVFKDKNFSGD